jgi:hypothetical protein
VGFPLYVQNQKITLGLMKGLSSTFQKVGMAAFASPGTLPQKEGL